MSRMRASIYRLIAGGLLVGCVLLILVANITKSENATHTSLLASIAQPTISAGATGVATFVVPTADVTHIKIHERSHMFDNASLEQVGQYVQQEAQGQLDAQGPSEVLLSRPVTYDEMPKLGLGCLGNSSSIEEPPLVLVILKGDFIWNLPGDSSPTGHFKYAVYVIDLWAPGAIYITGSRTGGLVKKALNDPSLPDEPQHLPTDCPARLPATAHYGSEMPGITFPTTPPAPTPLPVASYTVPPAVPTTHSTPVVPAPVPTFGP